MILRALFVIAYCLAAASTVLASPAAGVQNGIRYMSGGIGEEEEAALRAAADRFNLRLLFATKRTGEYLADVKVQVQDAKGATVLAAVSDGPCFLAALPAGRYRVTATARGIAQAQTATLQAKRPSELYFYWPENVHEGRTVYGLKAVYVLPVRDAAGEDVHGCW